MYTLEDFQSKKTVLYTVVAFAISEAICYSLKRWDRLSRYCEDGMLNIDNNPVERSIIPVALGRKNTCSADLMKQPKEVQCFIVPLALANYMVIIHLNTWTDVLKRLPSHPINCIKELLR